MRRAEAPGQVGAGGGLAVVAAVAAVTAGSCWAVKSGAILATGEQPPLLLELAVLPMAVAVLATALPLSRGPARTVATWCAAAGVVAGVLVALDETVVPLPGATDNVAIAAANLLVLVGLGSVGRRLRERGDRLPLLLAVLTVPAVAVGAALTLLVGDRALEAPLLVVGVAWVVMGLRSAGGRGVDA